MAKLNTQDLAQFQTSYRTIMARVEELVKRSTSNHFGPSTTHRQV